MAHTQPSPTGGVTPHHPHLAAHAPVNGHIPLQSQAQKGPPLSTAQKIAALNEQVWLQIGTFYYTRLLLFPSSLLPSSPVTDACLQVA